MNSPLRLLPSPRFSSLAFALLFSFPFLLSAKDSDSRSARQNINQVIRTAESFLGTPHRMGGLNNRGIDCSGLMYVSFSSANYTLPRISRDQATVGQSVKKKNLRRGDLVFFKQGRGIDHVGLVTEVNGNSVRFIHTSKSRGVMVSDVDGPYWGKHYHSARRIWNDTSKKSREEKVAENQPEVKDKKSSQQTSPAESSRTNTSAIRPASSKAVPGQFPQASERVLRKKELKRMKKKDLQLMRDEVYARHGFVFKDRKVNAYFGQQVWYKPLRKTRKFRKIKRAMTDIEKKNVKRIERYLD